MTKFKLYHGAIKDPHCISEYDTREERYFQMWAERLRMNPDLTWFNDPADPGLNTNAAMTTVKLAKLDTNDQDKIFKIIQKLDDISIDVYGQTIDDAADHLVTVAKRALEYISQDNESEIDNRNLFIHDRLKWAIENMEEWIVNVKEQAQSPVQMGIVGSNGRP